MIHGIGSAPVSFGVYGSAGPQGVSPQALLRSAARAGYDGMELGPPGFFGSLSDTREAFDALELAAVGAYVPIHFSGPDDVVEVDFAAMQTSLDELGLWSRPGLAILADEGAPELLSHPARPWHDRTLALDEAAWSRFAERLTRALDLAASAGIPISFHPHISTYIESPWEVERLLSMVPLGLTLDTGHFYLAGADPVESLVRWGDRVNHVHLKDVHIKVLRDAVAQGRTDFDTWWANLSTPLGQGDVDLEAFVTQLVAMDYDGWLVVEQDRAPLGTAPIEPITAVQADNRRLVAAMLQRLNAVVFADDAGGEM